MSRLLAADRAQARFAMAGGQAIGVDISLEGFAQAFSALGEPGE